MRIVVKVGTATLYQEEQLSDRIDAIVAFLAELNREHEVIFVSSGAVGAGYTKCKLDKNSPPAKQALAAIGQPLLMREYKSRFEAYDQLVAQVLISANDFDSKKRSENAKNMIEILLTNNVIPIINENDTVATEEIVFGDNDQLSAHAALCFSADILVILSDIDALYDKDPNVYSDAIPLKEVIVIKEDWLEMPCKPHDRFATGGIVTKIKAARLMNDHLKPMLLASGFDLSDAKSLLLERKQKGGTLFKAYHG